MVRKENQRIALTRRLLQEGLLRLLSHEKLENISVTALCKEAGINRATFYNHYTSPSALLFEMETQLVEELDQILDHVTAENIAQQVEQYCLTLKDNTFLVSILAHYHADQDIENIMGKIAAQYKQNRLNLNNTNLDPDSMHLASTYLYAGCYALVREWVLRDIDKTPKEIAELILSIVSKDYL